MTKKLITYLYFYLFIAIMLINITTSELFAMPVKEIPAKQMTAQQIKAKQIMEKVDKRDDGDNSTMNVEMVLIDKNQHKRTRKIKTFLKDKGPDTLRMQFFISPADVKDTAFLTFDYYSGEKDDDQWLYLPALKKIKRIASSDKSSSFMGSDFSYSDMNKRVLSEWKYKLLRESKVVSVEVWLIEALPANKTIEDRYGYTKSIVFVRKDNFLPIRAIHFVKDGKLIKYMDSKKIEKIDNIWVATEVVMKTTKNKKTLHKTILFKRDIKFNQSISEDMFTQRRLKKGL